jgi:predicted permease
MKFFTWFKRRRQRDHDLDEEIRAHMAMAIRERIEQGESPAEAEANAGREFGNATLVKEVTRDMWGWRWLETLLQDLRYGLRQLRRNPGFTAVAVVTLALAIGASTAAFSLLNYFVLRDLNVPHPHQLVLLGTLLSDEDYSLVSLPIFQEISEQQRVFSGMFLWSGGAGVSAETDDSIQRVDLWFVDGRYYSELGATPQIGRLIGRTDVDLNSGIFEHVAVLSYGFWQRQYGGRQDVLGRTLKIEGALFRIIGVTRRAFEGMEAEPEGEITVPLTAEPFVEHGTTDRRASLWRADARFFECTGRLRAGATIRQAKAQLEALWPVSRSRLEAGLPNAVQREQFAHLQLDIEPEAQGISYLEGRFTSPLFVVLGISGAALLIACLNLASMMLSRSAARRHEMGVRIALGASRWRIARQVLVESSVLAAGGALLGIVFADWGSRALRSFILGETMDIPVITKFGVDWRVLGFAAVATTLAILVFGVAPAWSAASEDPRVALQKGMRLSGATHHRLGNVLIVVQVALSMSLVTGAGLLIHSLEHLDHLNPGFRMQGLVRAVLNPKPGHHKGSDRVAYYRTLTNRVSQLPGVRAAGIGSFALGGLWCPTESIRPQAKRYAAVEADFAAVMPGFLRTAGIHLLCGRKLNWQDSARSPHVAILSENFAQEIAPGCKTLGKSLKITSEPMWPTVQVVGIVNNASLFDIRRRFPFTVYVPLAQYGNLMRSADLYVETNAAPVVAAKEISDIVRSLGQQWVAWFDTVSGFVHRSLVDQQVTATLSGFLGGVAFFLAAIGLYGVMAYSVSRRTNEIGIRMALGAQSGSIQRMILGETLWLLLAGVASGLPCTLGVARLIAHLLYGVSPDDPGMLALAICMLVCVGILAGSVPARRAAKVDPMVALRHE